MLCHWVNNSCNACIVRVKPEDECTMIFQNIKHYSPSDTGSHPRWLGPPAPQPLWEPQFFWITRYLGYIGRQVLISKERGEGLGPCFDEQEWRTGDFEKWLFLGLLWEPEPLVHGYHGNPKQSPIQVLTTHTHTHTLFHNFIFWVSVA